MDMRELREFCLIWHIEAAWNVDLAMYSSFRIGGKADAVLLPSTEEQLVTLLSFLKQQHIRYRVLGNASNVLFSDSGFRGAIIFTRHITPLCRTGNTLRASAGVPLPVLCRAAMSYGLSGAEALYGIPGTVGGAIYRNAGAFDTEMCDIVSFISVLDTRQERISVLSADMCRFGYRTSILAENRQMILLCAELVFAPGNAAEIEENMQKVSRQRREKQPLDHPSAGSAFLRPKQGYAGALIAKAGLSGFQVGGAAVSHKHAGFIINTGGASAADVLALMAVIQQKVKETSGISLVPEIEYIE